MDGATRESYKSVPQGCTRVPHKGFRTKCVLQDCHCIFSVFVLEYVFAFGFVGSILFVVAEATMIHPPPGCSTCARNVGERQEDP